MRRESLINFFASGFGMQQAKAEQIGIVAGNTTTLGGAGATVIFGLNLNEWGMVVGILVAVLGLVFSNYWQRKRNHRETQIALATIAALERGASISVITDDFGNVTTGK